MRAALSFSVLTVVAGGILFVPRAERATEPGEQEQKLWSVYWSAAPGFTSTLEVKNNRVKETLIVRPTLYLRSGEKLSLPSLTLVPRQTSLVNINEALPALSPDSPGRRDGSLEVDFVAANGQALMGTVSVTNPTSGIAWNFRLYTVKPSLPSAPVRGVFWFPDENTKGQVQVSNASDEFISVSPTFHVEGIRYSLPPTRLAPNQGFTLDLRDELHKLNLDHVRAGGIELNYVGPGDALKAHELLFNGKGFSTEVDLLPYEPRDSSHPQSLRTPQFAVGPADPKLGLPEHTVFEPTLALHNFDSTQLQVTLFVGSYDGNVPTEKQFPVALSPGQTQILALHSFLRDSTPTTANWASLEVEYSSNQNALAAALVSVSRDGAHSIRSVLNWVMGSSSDGPFWQADGDHTTLIGMYNADTQPAKVAVSLDYYVASERHKHKLPDLMIPARSATQIDVGAIIAAGEPDVNGDVIPPDITFGGYRVQKVGPRINKVLTTQSLLFDRSAKSYLTFYNTCCSLFDVTFSPGSVLGRPGDLDQLDIQALDSCGGNTIDVTDSGTFGSFNTSVATVGANNGTASLVSVGQTTLTSEITYFQEDQFVGGCDQTSSGSNTPTNVVSVTFSPISYVVVGQTATTNATVSPQNNTTPISLNITSAGAVVSPTGTFTTSTSVVVKGLSTGTATLTATVPNPEGGSPIPVGSLDIPVTTAAPTASLTQRTSGTVSSDDAAGPNYRTAEGTTNLGTIIGSGTSQGCFIGFETIGNISPSSYTGNVILYRTIAGDATYTNSTSTGGAPPGTDDTSFPALRDDAPQSGGSNGKVYDLDAPGVTGIPVDGNTYRIRTNFYAYAALPDGTVVSSSNYNFYVRVSCKKTSSGYQFVNDVPGDNQIGTGTTKTSWNLQ